MAARFWVGGSGTWDNSSTSNWSATSGGAPGASAPTASDTVTFDSNSGTAATVTVEATAVSFNTTVNKSDIILSLSGSPTLVVSAQTLILTTGTVVLNSYTLTIGRFSSQNTNVRTVDFGTGNITLTGSSTTIWATATALNLTFLGTPTVNATYSGGTGTRVINGSSTDVSASNIANFNISAGTDIVTVANSFNIVNFTGFSGTLNNSARTIYGSLTISSGMTCTAGASATTFAATSGTQQITTNGNSTIDFPITFDGVGGTWQLVDNLTTGSTRTVTLTNGALDLNNNTLSCGLFSSNNSNTRSIAFGTGNITLTGSGATIWAGPISSQTVPLTVTGTPVVNCTYSGSTGTRTLSTGFTTLIGEANAISFNISAGSDTVTTTGNHCTKNLNFTGFTGTLTANSRTVFGNLTLASGMTLGTGTGATTFAATSGNQTITINNLTLDFPITFDGVGGTWSFADALTQGSTRAFTITNGTVKLKAGATSTVGAFATSGSNQKYLQSTTAGSQATLSQASGTVDVSYLTIQDNNAVGGAAWNAYVNQQNIDAGNNDGWDFGISPIVGSYEYTYQLRSFTQPRRF